MGRNNHSLKFQLMERLDSLQRFGSKKHIQQIQNKKLGKGYKSDYIHSIRTMELYRSECIRFLDYLKDNNLKYKNINDIPRSVVADYIISRNSLSAWTSHVSLAAMNKIFGHFFTSSELVLKPRRVSEIKNNRNLVSHRTKELERYAHAVYYIRNCGFRRQSVSKICYNNFVFNSSTGLAESVNVIEKGGKTNYYYILPEAAEQITQELELYKNKPTVPLFPDFDPNRHINTHNFRNEYSCSLFNQLKYESDNGAGFFNDSDFLNYGINSSRVSANFRKHGDYYKGYDTMLISLVSQCLGHFRLDVVVNHYLRF